MLTTHVQSCEKAIDMPTQIADDAEIERQCLALRNDPAEIEALEFIERVMDYSGWV